MPILFPQNYIEASNKQTKKPIYILEILWADGSHGIEGTNDIYFGTDDIGNIVNFTYPDRYFPFLDTSNLSAVTQKMDPINGVSTIGSMTFSLIDQDNTVSQIISDADAAGHGLRRQRVEFYLLYAGMDWADRVKVRTMQISNLVFDHKKSEYRVSCADIQDRLKKKVFAPASTYLLANVANATDTTISVNDSSVFTFIDNASADAASIDTAAYAKIEEEIVKITAAPTATTITVTRGALLTTAAAHTIQPNQSLSIDEIVVLRGNPVVLALNTLISGASGVFSGSAVSVFSTSTTATVGTKTITVSPTSSDTLVLSFDLSTLQFYPNDGYFRIKDNTGAVYAEAVADSVFNKTVSVPDGLTLLNGATFFNIQTIIIPAKTPAITSITLEYSFYPAYSSGGGFSLRSISLSSSINVYDVYPSTWGAALDPSSVPAEVDQAAWEAFGALATGLDTTATNPILTGIQFEFVMDKGITAKKLIEEQILKITGGFQIVKGDGSLSVKGYSDLYQTNNDISAFDPSLTVGVNDIISWTNLNYNYQKMANEVLLEFDEHVPLSGKLIRSVLFLDADSRNRWGQAKPLSYKSFGLQPYKRDMAPVFTRLATVLSRLAHPPLSMKLTLPSAWHSLEVGDLIRVQLPIEDLSLQPAGQLDRVFEIISTSFNETTGQVVVDIEAQPTKANMTAIQQRFFPANAERSTPTAYQVGTALTSGTIANGTVLGAIDTVSTFYRTGSLTLPAGSTLNIYGSVILYVDGDFTLSGVINGAGRGASGSPEGTNSNPGGWAYGAAPSNSGYVGRGGHGGTVGTSGGKGWGTQETNAPRHAQAPVVTPVIAQGGASLTGVPTEGLWGGGGGTSGYDNKAGGNGGAGLVVICRGIIMDATTTSIDLSGANGASGVGDGGGGGGGSMLVCVERQSGIGSNFITFQSKVITTGGSAGGAALLGYGRYAAQPWGGNGGGGGSYMETWF